MTPVAYTDTSRCEPDRVTVCPECGGGDLGWVDEVDGWGASPVGTGYSIQRCEECGAETGERWYIGF